MPELVKPVRAVGDALVPAGNGRRPPKKTKTAEGAAHDLASTCDMPADRVAIADGQRSASGPGGRQGVLDAGAALVGRGRAGATVVDDTGALTIVFFGRRRLAGVPPAAGSWSRAWSASTGATMAMLNPAYEIQTPLPALTTLDLGGTSPRRRRVRAVPTTRRAAWSVGRPRVPAASETCPAQPRRPSALRDARRGAGMGVVDGPGGRGTGRVGPSIGAGGIGGRGPGVGMPSVGAPLGPGGRDGRGVRAGAPPGPGGTGARAGPTRRSAPADRPRSRRGSGAWAAPAGHRRARGEPVEPACRPSAPAGRAEPAGHHREPAAPAAPACRARAATVPVPTRREWRARAARGPPTPASGARGNRGNGRCGSAGLTRRGGRDADVGPGRACHRGGGHPGHERHDDPGFAVRVQAGRAFRFDGRLRRSGAG